MTDVLHRLVALTRIDVSYNYVDVGLFPFPSLFRGLSALVSLRHLVLNGNTLASIRELGFSSRTLETLELHGCKIGNIDAVMLARDLATSCPALLHLNLMANPIQEYAVAEIHGILPGVATFQYHAT